MNPFSPLRQLGSLALVLWLSGCSGQALVTAPAAPTTPAPIAPHAGANLIDTANRYIPQPAVPSARASFSAAPPVHATATPASSLSPAAVATHSASPPSVPPAPAIAAPAAVPAAPTAPAAASSAPVIVANAAPTVIPSAAPPAAPIAASARFQLGANLPWINYGSDFGASAWFPQGGIAQPGPRAQLDRVLATLAGQGVRQVRWFMLTDGRAGIRFAADGTPLGLDDYFFADVDAALAAARQHGIRVMFTLLDFHWCDPARTVNGVQLGGHLDVIADPAKRQALLDNVFKPLLQRFGQDGTIQSWDIMNEPEWATYGVTGVQANVSVSPDKLQDLIGRAAGYVHRYTTQQATVGSAGAFWLHYWTGLGLDFYQTHWYDYMEGYAPLAAPVASLKLDRPVILGEFPTAGSQYSPQQILDAAYQAGYSGAMPWAATLVDDHSTGSAAFEPLLLGWARANPAA